MREAERRRYGYLKLSDASTASFRRREGTGGEMGGMRKGLIRTGGIENVRTKGIEGRIRQVELAKL